MASQVNLYQRCEAPQSFEDLLAARKRNVRALLAAGADGAEAATPEGGESERRGFDWERVIDRAVVGAVMGAILAVIVIAIGKSRRRGQN